MGYYTNYELSVVGADKIPEAIESKIRETGNGDGDYYFSGETYLKWYDHEDDLKTVSNAFPNATLRLVGYGEGSGDAWVKFFCRGQMQRIDWEPPQTPTQSW